MFLTIYIQVIASVYTDSKFYYNFLFALNDEINQKLNFITNNQIRNKKRFYQGTTMKLILYSEQIVYKYFCFI